MRRPHPGFALLLLCLPLSLLDAFGVPSAAARPRSRTVCAAATSADAVLAELSQEHRDLAETLLELDQGHIFDAWAPSGQDEDKKQAFFAQVAELEANYPGGLTSYVTKARDLLEKSAAGENPFEGFTPRVPEGDILDFGDKNFDRLEALGLEAAAEGVGFVLVAGGLGERLGYDGIKVELPVDLLTGRSFLQHYVDFILALQRRLQDRVPGLTLPLTIMTSGDTDARTRKLLEENENFGMEADQLHVVKQEKVAALMDRKASLAVEEKDPYAIQTKPHGHGDVHVLLRTEGLLDKFQAAGLKWLFFFQDTNVLVVNSVLPTLGVCKERDLDMTSICVPRTAGEAAGAITRLENEETGEELTINVEYNQLDPLLRATISPDDGDTNDPTLGYSPFPGNANNLVFKLDAYKATCEGAALGVVPEFVNPKYADAERTVFKKPTRLECMMQDFPRLMQAELPQGTSKVGFVSFPKWLSFSPAKNSLEGGADNAKGGNPPGTVASSEVDFYSVLATKMEALGGVNFLGDPTVVDVEGVATELGPFLYVSPATILTTDGLKAAFGKLGALRMDRTSALQVEGAGRVIFSDVVIEGDLTIEVAEGVTLLLQGTRISTAKPEVTPLDADAAKASPFLAIRGYDLVRPAEGDRAVLRITEPGTWNVEGDVASLKRVSD